MVEEVFLKTGVPTEKDLEKVTPPQEYLEKGCVILECFQRIPCDPCKDICPKGAIKIEENVNNLPIVDYSKCNGCGICIAGCPGLAIFVVNQRKGIVKLPYERKPLPKKNEKVKGIGRDGRVICETEVVDVTLTPKQNKTAIITIKVEKKFVMKVREIRREK
jgi:Fe-S-cluster-containing hydrogenase component 2